MNIVYKYILYFFLLNIQNIFSQYTDIINTNRPSTSIGAFSVGKGVIQIESELETKSFVHKSFNNSTLRGNKWNAFLRYGFLLEKLELNFESSFFHGTILDKTFPIHFDEITYGFTNNTLGVKYLLFDPFVNQNESPNIYSWDANNKFKFENLIPAVSVTFGINLYTFFNTLLLENNPYPYEDLYNSIYLSQFQKAFEEPLVTSRLTIATQSILSPNMTLISNWTIDKILANNLSFEYVFSFIYLFNDKISMFIDNRGVQNVLYSDAFFRMGLAALSTKNLQLDGFVSTSVKNTPYLLSLGFGVSYRLDRFNKN